MLERCELNLSDFYHSNLTEHVLNKIEAATNALILLVHVASIIMNSSATVTNVGPSFCCLPIVYN